MNGDWPAFPQPREDASLMDEGITIRDYFAAAALQGILASAKQFNMPDGSKMDGETNMAKVAYWVADAMLKARGEQ